METKLLLTLIKKYNAKQCTPAEKQQLEQWYLSFEWRNHPADLDAQTLQLLKDQAWNSLNASKQSAATNKAQPLRSYYWLYTAAAMLLVAIGFGLLYQKLELKANKTAQNKPLTHDVMPGSSKAQLIMAGGNVVTLDASQSLKFNETDGTQIKKEGGKLAYNNAKTNGNANVFHTLITPKGGKYQLVLPDGTKVWLNAASSLSFPTKFASNKREISLKGEAYFEVAHLYLPNGKKKVPFVVKVDGPNSNKGSVEVLGTHFNVNAYADEATVNTTLLSGAVKVNMANKAVVLAPGQLAQLTAKNELEVLNQVDTTEVVAWKNGYFHFESADLPTILRQFSRWYDVEVAYEGKIKPRRFFGMVSRSSSLATALELLKENDVYFRIEGKKLIVKSI